MQRPRRRSRPESRKALPDTESNCAYSRFQTPVPRFDASLPQSGLPDTYTSGSHLDCQPGGNYFASFVPPPEVLVLFEIRSTGAISRWDVPGGYCTKGGVEGPKVPVRLSD